MVSRGGVVSVTVHCLVVIGVFAGRPSAVVGGGPVRDPVIDLRYPVPGGARGSSDGASGPVAPKVPFGPVDVPLIPTPPVGSTPGVDPRTLIPACDSACVHGGAEGRDPGVAPVAEPDVPPRMVAASEPRYPEALRRAGIRGSVTVEFVVDAAGRVESGSVVVESATDPAFSASAVESVRGERFSPGRSRGVAVRTRVRQLIQFSVY
ncbi:MAG: energy transducer TonB [Gemmatimonadales bacterium]